MAGDELRHTCNVANNTITLEARPPCPACHAECYIESVRFPDGSRARYDRAKEWFIDEITYDARQAREKTSEEASAHRRDAERVMAQSSPADDSKEPGNNYQVLEPAENGHDMYIGPCMCGVTHTKESPAPYKEPELPPAGFHGDSVGPSPAAEGDAVCTRCDQRPQYIPEQGEAHNYYALCRACDDEWNI